jgi:putative heme-binding domain-containing protein
LLAGLAAAQQHNYSPQDVETGARIYNANCFACHGQNGDLVPGIDLRRGVFPSVSSDDDIAKFILNGVPGTAMPPNRLNPQELQGVVAFIRSLKDAGPATQAKIGDAARGRALIEGKGGCLACHQVLGKGSHTAPDLSEEGVIRNAAFLEAKLRDPQASVQPKDRFIRAVTRKGETITGRRLNEDTDTVQIIDSQERLLSLDKADLREYSIRKETPMPSYKDKLTADEVADVVGYLASLKGVAAK